MRKRVFLAPVLAALLALPALAQMAAKAPKLPPLEFQDVHLDNGLRVILAPDHAAPVFGICVTYNVGSRNERPGRTGPSSRPRRLPLERSDTGRPRSLRCLSRIRTISRHNMIVMANRVASFDATLRRAGIAGGEISREVDLVTDRRPTSSSFRERTAAEK